jgi:hypothetical protein
MAHFAEIDEGGTVLRVIVADQDFIDSGVVGDKTNWVQTSYNTHGGVHSRGKSPLRKNYTGIGYQYDVGRDAFIPPKPFNSWLIDEAKGQWKAPVNMPNDGKRYSWDEKTLDWIAE